MSIPLVSVIIPVYNASATLQRAIDCVLNQSFEDWELILVDDASTDVSDEIIRKNVYKDDRIRSITLQNNSGGAFLPRKIAIEAARTDLIAPLDADDFVDSGYLSELLNQMQQNEGDIIYPTMVIHGKDRSIPPTNVSTPFVDCGPDLVKRTLAGWDIPAGGGIIKKKLYLDCIKNVEFFNFITADELLTRILLYNASRVVISDVKYHYQINDNSVTHRISSRLFGLLVSDRFLAQFINGHYSAYSAEVEKVELQKFFDFIDGIHKYIRIKGALLPIGRARVWKMLDDTYSEIRWDIVGRETGWKYRILKRCGLKSLYLMFEIYDRLRFRK